MQFLLDTHALLWWLEDSRQLTDKAKAAIADPSNTLYVSSASIWEMSIKKALGKLICPDNLSEIITDNQFLELQITAQHAELAGRLPTHHQDPFDRMLIAQAKLEKLKIITKDHVFQQYTDKLLII